MHVHGHLALQQRDSLRPRRLTEGVMFDSGPLTLASRHAAAQIRQGKVVWPFPP